MKCCRATAKNSYIYIYDNNYRLYAPQHNNNDDTYACKMLACEAISFWFVIPMCSLPIPFGFSTFILWPLYGFIIKFVSFESRRTLIKKLKSCFYTGMIFYDYISDELKTTLIRIVEWLLILAQFCPGYSTDTTAIITLRPRRNEQHFADDTLKRILFNENVWISIKISLKFVPNGPINNIPALVQIMAWRRPGDKPLSDEMMVSLLTHICVTRPQWVIQLTQCELLQPLKFWVRKSHGVTKNENYGNNKTKYNQTLCIVYWRYCVSIIRGSK